MADTDERDHKQFCRTLRGLRKRAGLTGDELAERAGMSQSKISKIETGRTVPSVADVEVIARVLDMPADVRAELVPVADALNTRVENHRLVYRRGLATKQRESPPTKPPPRRSASSRTASSAACFRRRTTLG